MNRTNDTNKIETLKRKVQQLQDQIFQSHQEKNKKKGMPLNWEENIISIINSLQDPLFIKDKNLRYTIINQAQEKLFGIPIVNLIGKTDEDIFGKDTFKNTAISDSFVLDDNVVEIEQAYNINREIRRFQIFKAPLKDGGNQIVGICGIAHDITALKRTEEKLRENEEHLRSIINSSQDAIFIKDTNLKYIFVNPAMEKMLGLSAPQIIDHTDDEIFGKDIATYMKPVDYSVLTGKIIEEENEYEVRGSLTTLHTTKTPLRNKQGKIIGVYGISRDVTDQKLAERAVHKSEKQYQALLNAMPDLMLQVKNNGVIIDFKRAKNFRVCMSDYLIGQTLDKVLPEEGARQALALMKKAVHMGKLQLFEFQHTINDEMSYFEGRITQIDNDELLIIIRDITEGKLAEKELRNRNEELDAFAHTVAHDLKNPLAGIITSTEMLQASPPNLTDEHRNIFMDSILQGAHKMGNIIKELLLLAGVRKENVQKNDLDMQIIVSEALSRLSYMIEEMETQIIFPHYWPIAVGHGPWVEEVWANYISNAMKYGGSPPIVQLGSREKDKGMIEFWVKDNGPGLTLKEQEKLFSEFTRFHQVRAEGQGLGLSIVRRIMGRLDGDVGVRSELGKGSTFYFTLPAYKYIESQE